MKYSHLKQKSQHSTKDIELLDKVKQSLRLVTNPVNVITTQSQSKTISGITVNSVTSLSMDPILLTFNVKLPSHFSAQLHQTQYCAINTLTTNQKSIAQFFSKPGHGEFDDSQNHFSWLDSIPYLNKSLATFLCKVKHVFPVADHEVWVVQVIEVASGDNHDTGLLYRNQKYI
ncbi:hypothetical protein K502DRAFT_316901 [Neoconidiobolus thromboides FSU 785]|nr:hypothetical protein K502DRAFT_316901 [Neoconidiobolus thromboides FSU 785]